MVGLFSGLPGARRWRQMLSTDATKPGASSDVLREAYATVAEASAEAA
jgi:tRNA-dihydrouridine synthase A